MLHSQASLAVCRCAALLLAPSGAVSVFGRGLAESTDPSVWPPAQPKLKSKTARAMALRYGRVARWTRSLERQRQQQKFAVQVPLRHLAPAVPPVSSDGRCFVRRPQRIGAGLRRCQELVSYHGRQCLQVVVLFVLSRPSSLR